MIWSLVSADLESYKKKKGVLSNIADALSILLPKLHISPGHLQFTAIYQFMACATRRLHPIFDPYCCTAAAVHPKCLEWSIVMLAFSAHHMLMICLLMPGSYSIQCSYRPFARIIFLVYEIEPWVSYPYPYPDPQPHLLNPSLPQYAREDYWFLHDRPSWLSVTLSLSLFCCVRLLPPPLWPGCTW